LKQLIVLSFVLLSVLPGCRDCTISGPFFGNGVHNGWADQNSIVIWTRLTSQPEMNRTGPQFLPVTAEEHRVLRKMSDADTINARQIPEGFTLNQMEGACPGMAGEVRMVCHPLKDPEKKIEKPWSPVDPERNFTIHWKLEGLTSGTKYILQLEARRDEKSGVTATQSGSFRTPPDKDIASILNFYIVTCHDYPRRDDSINGHRIYRSMLDPFPDFLVHTGDIEYYDKPLPFALTEELMRFKWNRIFALPYQRDYYSRVTTYFMKDDHDVLSDDAFPGMKYGTVGFDRGLEIFDREQFHE
jgi:alkaline phosphatase D